MKYSIFIVLRKFVLKSKTEHIIFFHEKLERKSTSADMQSLSTSDASMNFKFHVLKTPYSA